MIEARIRRNSPTLGDAEAAAASNAVLANWAGRGPETAHFENEFCELHGLSDGHAVAVSSGTAALYLALSALQAGGKRVALPAYACQPLLHAVRAIRAEPVIIDSRLENDPNVDLEALGAKGVDVAIVPHSFGIPQIIGAQPAQIIEDCAQALGAVTGGARVGLQGTIAVFSFGPTKMITTAGAGGMLLSKDVRCIEYVRDYLAYYDRDDDKVRFNFEITDVQSAVGRVQLRRLTEFVARREELSRYTATPALRYSTRTMQRCTRCDSGQSHCAKHCRRRLQGCENQGFRHSLRLNRGICLAGRRNIPRHMPSRSTRSRCRCIQVCRMRTALS